MDRDAYDTIFPDRDCGYFLKLGPKESIRQLAAHERNGTLPEFIKEAAPGYYIDRNNTLDFLLCTDAGLFEYNDEQERKRIKQEMRFERMTDQRRKHVMNKMYREQQERLKAE